MSLVLDMRSIVNKGGNKLAILILLACKKLRREHILHVSSSLFSIKIKHKTFWQMSSSLSKKALFSKMFSSEFLSYMSNIRNNVSSGYPNTKKRVENS